MTRTRGLSNTKAKAFKVIGSILMLSVFLYGYIGNEHANIVPNNDDGPSSGVKKVVLDAGHGGKDPGALGANGLLEKDVALYITLAVGELIQKNHPDIEVIYTRDKDVFVELHQRAKIANDANADLFISIHADAAANKNAYGTETFCLGPHRNAANLEIAKRENAAILFEDGHEEHYAGFDENDEDSFILRIMMQGDNLDKSKYLADHIQGQFKGAGRKDRGVKQAGFLVLYKTTMPSILVETGFVTNPDEGEFLRNNGNKDKLAQSIYTAFKAYNEKISINDAKLEDASSSFNENDSIVDPNTATKIEPMYSDSSASIQPILTAVEGDSPGLNQFGFFDHVTFGVQIGASAKSYQDNSNVKDLKDIWQYRKGDWYKYVIGKYSSMKVASVKQQELRENGYPDAFVVFFNSKGERLTKTEYQKLINQ